VLDAPEVDVVGALVEQRAAGFKLRTLRRELGRGRGGYVLVMAANSIKRRSGSADEPAAQFLERYGVPVWHVEDLYAAETLELMRGTRPDAIFRSGFGIIREPVLSLAPAGVLSYHHGNIRRYRGQPVGFWELFNGETEMGVTLQILGEKLDAGTVVAERTVRIRPTDSWRQLERRAYAAGTDMLLDACASMARQTLRTETVAAENLGELYTLPNLRQWLTLQGRVLGRRMRARLAG